MYLDSFGCVKINVSRFQARDACQMHNQYKTGAGRGSILGQPMLLECMGICVLSPVHESEMRGYLDYVLIVKKTYLIDFVQIQPQYIRLDDLIVEFRGIF